MDPSSIISESIAKIADIISQAEKLQFEALWSIHTSFLAIGKYCWFIPKNMGSQLGKMGLLQKIARKLRQVFKILSNISANKYGSQHLHLDVYIHYDNGASTYRIGPIVDQQDRNITTTQIFISRENSNGTVQSIGQDDIQNLQNALQNALQQSTNAVLGPAVPVPTVSASQTQLARPANNQPSIPTPPIYHTRPVSPGPAGRRRVIHKMVPKIPKPRNSWIIYRQLKHKLVLAANPGMHTSDICELQF
jgi:hypothetical protein